MIKYYYHVHMYFIDHVSGTLNFSLAIDHVLFVVQKVTCSLAASSRRSDDGVILNTCPYDRV
jgi:hypothetical protein